MRFDLDGLAVWFGTPDAPAPVGSVAAADGAGLASVTVTAGVQPPSASNSMEVVYSVNGGATERLTGQLTSHDAGAKTQYFVAGFPALKLGDAVRYSVVARSPGRQVPAAGAVEAWEASFEVMSASQTRAAHDGVKAFVHRERLLGVDAGGVSVGGGVGVRLGSGGVSVGLRRVPLAVDPLASGAGGVGGALLPMRVAAVSRLYLGMDRLRGHLAVLDGVLAERALPGVLVGILVQPDGSAARLVHVELDPGSVGGSGAKVSVMTNDEGHFQVSLPRGARVPAGGGVPLVVHGSDGSVLVAIGEGQIAASGWAGSVTLPRALAALPVSIVAALEALVPAGPAAVPAGGAAQSGGQRHVVKLGEDDVCQLSFACGGGEDRFPFGVFFRLVEPQTSIPAVASSVAAREGFVPIPSYAMDGGLAGAGSGVMYLDRVPVEQPLSVDGFRDQVAGATTAGVVSAEETLPMAGTLGLGYVLWLSQRWTFQGLALGDLVYSLPLAPGEQQVVAIFERVDTAAVQASEFFSEEEVEQQRALADTSTQATFSSAFNEAVQGASQFSAQASSTSWSVGGSSSIGILSFGGSGGGGNTSSSGQSSEWLQGQRNTTQQAAETTHSSAENQAAARRTAAHTSMSLASASESETATTKVITNHNHTRALTLQYWEVQRLYDVRTGIDGLGLVCLVPMQVVRFLPAGQSLTLPDASGVASRAAVIGRYESVIKHADVLGRALPGRFRYGLSLLTEFAADPTAQVEPFGGAAEDVIMFALIGTFVPCEEIYITAVTNRRTRVGPVKLINTATLPKDAFASRDQLLAWLGGVRQQAASPVSLAGSLALPPDLNRSDVVGFELSRRFRQVDYTLLPPEIEALSALAHLFPGGPAPSAEALLKAAGQDVGGLARATVHVSAAELESALGGPLLAHFQASIQDLSASGDPASPAKGETYANDSLNGTELPAQPYPVPAIQVGPVLRYNQILEIEKMTQHVVRNTVTYSKAVWASMSADERAILLEPYTIGVPADGISDASQMIPLLNCIENRVLGFFGNSMMLPFMIPQALAEQMHIDPVALQASLLTYQQQAFASPQSTIALPTPGVLGEAVLGHCQSAEKIDLTRFWNWADAPADTAPTISPVTLPTTTPSIAAGLQAPNTLTNLPPLINNVLTPPTPDTTLLQTLSKNAASQQDFNQAITGAEQLSSQITNAQNTANAARADAIANNTKLITEAMTTAANIINTQTQQAHQSAQQTLQTTVQAAQHAAQQGQQTAQQAQAQQGQQPQTKPGQTGDGKGPGQPGTSPTGQTDGTPTTGTPGTNGSTSPDTSGLGTGTNGLGAGAGDLGAGDVGAGSLGAGAGDLGAEAGAADLGAGGGAGLGADAGLAADAAILLA